MKPVKIAALMFMSLAVGLIPGCGGRHSAKEVYYLVTTNSSLTYWKTVVAGFKKAAAEYKVTARVVGPDNYDPQAELDQLQRAVAAKPAGILISVSDAAVLTPGIDAAIQAGIPVVTIDSDSGASHRLFFIGTNNIEAGRLGGRRVVDKLGGKGNVVFFTFSGQPNTEERLKGFKDVFSGYPGMKILEVNDIKNDARLAYDKADQLLAQTGAGKVDAFVCLDSSSGKMVADAIKREGKVKPLLVAWDVDPDTLQGIKDGVIDSTLVQKPYTMGYAGLRALDEIFHNPAAPAGKEMSTDAFAPYPAFIDTGTSLVDKTNVEVYFEAAQSHTM
jgi:ribose transport system substrate-binding protein